MGIVERILSDCSETMLQSLMHDRIALETCENIHFHWRNARVEMSLSDVGRLLDICWRFERIMPLLQGMVVAIPLRAINPYDDIHRRVTDDEFDNGSPKKTAEHKAGICWMIDQMKAGKKPWPIAVRPAWRERFTRMIDRKPGNIWQRLDGFKRYMAHKELNCSTIDCFLITSHRPGCQHGHRAFQEDGDTLPRAFPSDFFMEARPDCLSLVNADKQRYLRNQVELLRNDTVHVHVGDVRLEFTRKEFTSFARMIQNAQQSL